MYFVDDLLRAMVGVEGVIFFFSSAAVVISLGVSLKSCTSRQRRAHRETKFLFLLLQASPFHSRHPPLLQLLPSPPRTVYEEANGRGSRTSRGRAGGLDARAQESRRGARDCNRRIDAIFAWSDS